MIWSALISEATAWDLPMSASAFLSRGFSCHPFLWVGNFREWDAVARRFYWRAPQGADVGEVARAGVWALHRAAPVIFPGEGSARG